jgi:hypothetical protein
MMSDSRSRGVIRSAIVAALLLGLAGVADAAELAPQYAAMNQPVAPFRLSMTSTTWAPAM